MPTDQYSFHASTGWDGRDKTKRVVTVTIRGRASFEELMAELGNHGFDKSLTELEFNGSVKWTRDATQEEVQHQADLVAAAEARREEYERGQMAKWIEKYGLPE